ncbi:DUF2255 family protein, partial [Kribbella sp. NPDC050470]|uniref:DUF2255 family protein n=1 Tax=unclassified Kribbella TaxID=2644121 RepID=UPI00379E47DF
MTQNGWTPDELTRIGGATELKLASYRKDGTLRRYITMWTVAVGTSIYVRSAYGTDNPWFRRAVAAGRGRIRAGGVERDVDFTRLTADDPLHTDIDTAYHTKYDRYGARLVATVTGDQATHTTIRLLL